MSLRSLRTRIITQQTSAGGSLVGFIVASLRTWFWQTESPCNPVQLASIAFAGPNDGAISIPDVNGNALYVSGGADSVGTGTSNLYIYNISNPLAPTLTSNTSFTIGGNPPTLLGLGYLGHIGTTVYLASNGAQGPGNIITVVDASNPAAPTLVSQAAVPEYSAAVPGVFLQCAHSLVYLSGLNAAGTNQQLTIYNSSMVNQGSLTNANLAFILVNWPTLYSVKGNKLLAVDVTTATAPALVTTTTLPDNIQSVLVPLAIDSDNNLLYVISNGVVLGRSIFVYDISDPTHPAFLRTISVVNSFTGPLNAAFAASGVVNVTAGGGPMHLFVYTAGGSLIGDAVVNSGVASMSGAIVRAA